MSSQPNSSAIEYMYLDIDNEKLYSDKTEYGEALKNRSGRATEVCILNFAHDQCLYAAGIKTNGFGEIFTEIEAILMCRKLSGIR